MEDFMAIESVEFFLGDVVTATTLPVVGSQFTVNGWIQLSGLDKNYIQLYVGAASCREICILNDPFSRLEAAPT
jgi:hypothetical protein